MELNDVQAHLSEIDSEGSLYDCVVANLQELEKKGLKVVLEGVKVAFAGYSEEGSAFQGAWCECAPDLAQRLADNLQMKRRRIQFGMEMQIAVVGVEGFDFVQEPLHHVAKKKVWFALVKQDESWKENYLQWVRVA